MSSGDRCVARDASVESDAILRGRPASARVFSPRAKPPRRPCHDDSDDADMLISLRPAHVVIAHQHVRMRAAHAALQRMSCKQSRRNRTW